MINMKAKQILLFFLTLTICCHAQDATKKIAQEAAREKLLHLFAGEWVARGIYAATKLEIAEHLQAGAKSVEELANLTGSNPDSLGRLLQMLAGFGLFQEVSPEIFSNTATSLLLIKTDADSLHDLSIFYGEDIHKSWEGLFPSIQTGTPAFELAFKQPVFSFFKEHPERAAIFQAAMKEKSKAVIKSVLSNYDFSQFHSVCDVGGGYGQFVQSLLQKYPNLSGTLFELPEVVEKIKQQTPHFESKHCHLVSGDFFKSIPKGKDLYLLKSVIHDWEDEKAEKILKNCHHVMGSDSRLLIVEVVLQSGNQHSYANCMDFLMLAITGGKERSLSSLTHLLENSGFVIERIYPTTTEFSIIEAKKK